VCGNQWLADTVARANRYSTLALLLADDRIRIDTRVPRCERYLALELSSIASTAPGMRECGGRTPQVDAVDAFRSLLVGGRESGIDDGVSRDDREHSSSEFPFLAAP
jgi:hypothetical protein